MLRFSLCVTAVCVSLGACSSGESSSTTASTPATGGTSTAASTLFGLTVNADVPVHSYSASLNEGTSKVRAYDQDFTFRSRNSSDQSNEFRRIRYGKPFQSYHPHRNYTLPITVTDSGGQMLGTGSATFTGSDVETGVTSRTITITDMELDASIFGLFSTDDTGPRGDFFEIHAYSTGIPTPNSGLPNMATYTGSFLADVISDGTTEATRIELPANISIDFNANSLTGELGTAGSPDITLNGTLNGSGITGTALINSTEMTLVNGSSGSFNGGLYGAGAAEVAGTLGISDKSGAINHELVGAFGAKQN